LTPEKLLGLISGEDRVFRRGAQKGESVMTAQTDERGMGAESRPAQLGPFGDIFICLGVLAVLIVIPAIVATLVVTIGDFAMQHVELPNFHVYRN
jgi:hypothetical protein